LRTLIPKYLLDIERNFNVSSPKAPWLNDRRERLTGSHRMKARL
jgi:hypothetical protein